MASPLELGRFLFQEYWFAVEIASFLLLIALVGALYLGRYEEQAKKIPDSGGPVIVSFSHVLSLALLLFILGAVCAVARRNLIMILIGVEIMLNAAGLAFIGASLKWQHLDGQAFVIFILTVAASEVAVGLALIVYSYRRTGSVDANRLQYPERIR